MSNFIPAFVLTFFLYYSIFDYVMLPTSRLTGKVLEHLILFQ